MPVKRVYDTRRWHIPQIPSVLEAVGEALRAEASRHARRKGTHLGDVWENIGRSVGYRISSNGRVTLIATHRAAALKQYGGTVIAGRDTLSQEMQALLVGRLMGQPYMRKLGR